MELELSRVLFLSDEVLQDLSDDLKKLIVEKLNTYNPKLRVKEICSFPVENSFSIVKHTNSSRFAVIAESRPENLSGYSLKNDEALFELVPGKVETYKAVLYLFVSPLDFAWRNVFATQTIFPGLCTLIDEMQVAPGVAFSAHPIYFLDIATGSMTDSIRRTLSHFVAMGFGYVSAQRNDFDPESVPRDLGSLLRATGDQARAGRKYYSIDENSRTLTYLSAEFKPGALLATTSTPKKWAFGGSNDKFYWSEVLPIAVVAAHSGFKIDCSEVLNYLNDVLVDSDGAKMSQKFYRTVALFKYIEKISELNS